MKRMLILVLVIALLVPGAALAYLNPTTGMSMDSPSVMYGYLKQRMATRTGPGTQYSEPGTFYSEGTRVKLISCTTDTNGVKWVQAEIDVNGSLMRVYTGLKRFSGVDASKLCREERLNVAARLDSSITPTYGPGWKYAEYNFTLSEGSQVLILDHESNFDMCEFYVNNTLYRAWLPDAALIPE